MNDEQITVWAVTMGKATCTWDDETDAREQHDDMLSCGEDVTIGTIEMTTEEYNNRGDFEGW